MSLRITEAAGFRVPPSSTPDVPPPQLNISVGIEGTFEPWGGKNTLSVTGHFRRQRWSRDFGLVRELGIGEVRYPIPWHEIEQERGRYR